MDVVVLLIGKPMRCLRGDMASDLVVEVWGGYYRSLHGCPHAPMPKAQGGGWGQHLKVVWGSAWSILATKIEVEAS